MYIKSTVDGFLFGRNAQDFERTLPSIDGENQQELTPNQMIPQLLINLKYLFPFVLNFFLFFSQINCCLDRCNLMIRFDSIDIISISFDFSFKSFKNYAWINPH